MEKSKQGYSIYSLGKNGEPKANQKLNIDLYPEWQKTQLKKSLVTNKEGKVLLGQLDGIIDIIVKDEHEQKIHFSTKKQKHDFPSKIYVVEN